MNIENFDQGFELDQTTDPWILTPVIKQDLPLFHDLSTPPSGTSSFLIALSELESTSNNILRNWLVKHGIIYPRKKITLSINPSNIAKKCTGKGDKGAAVAETPLWTFPGGHYLPDYEYKTDKISVIAWRSFPVTVSIKCKGKDNFETETIVVTVE